MKTTLGLKNFRIFDNKGAEVHINPLTVLTGCNSSGKSSIVKALILLSEFLKGVRESTHGAEPRLEFDRKPLSLLCNFDSIVNKDSKDGKLMHFKTGAALIAAQTGVPVVPVGIYFDGKLRFRSRILVTYGAPFTIPQTDPDNPSGAVLKQIRQEMSRNVAALLPMQTESQAQREKTAQKGE